MTLPLPLPFRRLRLLDLFCCQGGAAAGYTTAGWEVFGIDCESKFAKRYSGAGFRCDDAREALQALLRGEQLEFTQRDGTTVLLGMDDFDAIHLSPPCQYYSRGNAKAIKAARAANGDIPPETVNGWPRSIPGIRKLAEATGLPYVIENVTDAGWDMRDPVGLCGCMFDMSTIDTDGIRIYLQRERLFEVQGWELAAPRECDHSEHEWVAGAYGGARRDKYEAKYVRKGGYVPPDKEVVKRLLGVEHDMTWEGLFECVPPAYTEYIGEQLAAAVAQRQAA